MKLFDYIKIRCSGRLAIIKLFAKSILPTQVKLSKKNFKFHISDIEIDTLRKNIDFAHKVIDIEFLTPNEQLEGTWLWAKPKIYELD